MKRLAVLAACAVVCTVLTLTFLSTTATPSWSQLDQTVTVSREPIEIQCFQKCDHKGAGGVCISTTNTWMCANDTGNCTTIMNCIM